MRRSAATMSWLLQLLLLAVLCLLQGGHARPQRAGPGPAPPLPHHAQLSGAAANSMAPLTSEWRDESVRRLSGPEDVSPYAWKPLLSESPKRPARTSRDQQHHEPDSNPAPPEPKQPVSAPAGAPASAAASAPVEVLMQAPVEAPVEAPVAAPLVAPQAAPGPAAEQATSRAQPETSASAMSSPSGPYLPSPPSSPSSPSGPSAPSGTSPIGESLKEVASQLMGVTAAPNAPSVTKPQEVVLQDVRTPPIVKASTNNVIVSNNNHQVKPIKAQNLRPSDLPKPVVVSATVSTERDDDLESGFQGVAEPVVLADEHTAEHTALEAKKGNASAIMTTAEPQPSTTSSDRISTWILLSGTHSSATTPSSLKKRPALAPGSIVSKPQEGTPKLPSAPQQRPQQVRPMPVRKPNPAQNKLVSKRPPTTTSSTTTTSTPAPVTSTSSPQTAEYVKISETIISSVQKPKVSNNSQENNKKLPKPTNNTDAIAIARRPVQDKTKISSASVPFNTAVSHRRKPIHGSPILAIPEGPAKPAKAPKPVSASLKTTTAQTTPKPTTTTPAPEEITTVPSTIPELAVTTEDPNVATTIIPPSSTKKPKRTSTSSKKKKKKKKNKTRRRRPSKKTTSSSNHGSASSVTALESKIGNEGNVTSNKVGQNGISTKIYNYLAREVMPSVSVGIIGLVVTAGIAGLFLYPFGGGIAARRTYDEATPEHHHHGDHVYYYENYADHGVDSPAGKPEEEVLGQVFSGMQQQQQQQQHQAPETRYGAAPPIYGGGNSGPPDAQYSDSYNRYDPSGKGSTFGRPDANAEDLRQGTGYSSVSVNGQGQVTGYVDPSPVSVDSKYEALTPDAIQRTRYDVDTPADQVDLTYGGSAVAAADADEVPVASPSKKVDESPFVVGSVGSGVAVEAQHGNRYRVDNEAANVDITYGSDHYNHSKDEAVSSGSFSPSDHDIKPGNRYSVRVTGGTGQVALAYGSQSTDGVKLEQDVAYGTGTADSRYATASGAQPRSLPAAKLPTTRRRRRSAAEDDDLQLNEIDGPVPNNDLAQTSSARPESDRVEITTSAPEETTTTVPSTEAVTFLDPDTKDKENFIEGTRKTQADDKEAATESSSVSSSFGTSSTADSLRVSYQDQSTSSASTAAPPMWSTTTPLPPAVNATDDPLTALINIFRRVAEFKLRVGMNLLRGTSEAVSKYIGGVTRRMEEAADNLHQMHSLRRKARDLESRPAKHHTKKVLRSYLKKKQL